MRIVASLVAGLLGLSLTQAMSRPQAPPAPTATGTGHAFDTLELSSQSRRSRARVRATRETTAPATTAARPAAAQQVPPRTARRGARGRAAQQPQATSQATSQAPSQATPAAARPRGRAAAATAQPAPPRVPLRGTIRPAAAAAGAAAAASAPAAAVLPDSTKPSAKNPLQDTYAAIPAAERLAIQSDLVWTGDYNGLLDGEFGERMVEAVKSFQKRLKNNPTGVLTAAERTALSAAARPKQAEIGWALVEDPTTGGRVGVPGKLATVTAPGTTGTRWTSAQGQLQIETFRITTGATLDAVFEQEKRRNRRVTYNVLRPDFFVVSGTQGLKKFYVRAFAKNNEVRGITILYDQAMEGTMDPVVVAMASSFVPFPPSSGGMTLAGMRRKVEYGTGIVVSGGGHIITERQLTDGCQVIAVPGAGNAERLADDAASDLALIRVYGAYKLSPAGIAGGAPAAGAVTLVGIADPQTQGGNAAVTAVRAQIGARGNALALDTAPALGFSGAAAVDSQGRFAGMVVMQPSVVAGPGAAAPATVVPAETVMNFLRANNIQPAAPGSGVDDARGVVMRVICVRK